MIVLEEFSPWSGRAGTDEVGRSPRTARLELVDDREVMQER
jgi:hypothetical protein